MRITAQRTSVNVTRGSVKENVSGGEAVNVSHPVIREWITRYL